MDRSSKRAKYSPKKKSKVRRISRYSLNQALVHKHVVTVSTSSTEGLFITIPASGVSLFNMLGSTSPNLALTFSLAGMNVFLGGVAITTIPLPNVAELKGLYDSYVIEKIEISVWSGATVSQVGAVASTVSTTDYISQPMPLIGHTVDNDDAANTSLTALQQYSQYRCQQLGLGKPIKRSFVPCVNDTLSTSTGFGRAYHQVINSANDTVQHFGLKMSVDGFKAANFASVNYSNTLLSIQARYHLRMIATR